MSQLDEAIGFYCKMLSSLEDKPSPQEDTRLYTIAYFSFKGNSEVKPEVVLYYLESNEKLAGISTETMKSFVEKKIKEINHVVYILSRIPGLLV